MMSGFAQLWKRAPWEFGAKEALRGVRSAGIPTYREALPKLTRELRRARRYERALTGATISPAVPQPGDTKAARPAWALARNGDDQVATYLTFFVFGTLFRDALRETDILAYVPEQRCYAVLFPEALENDARQALARIEQVVRERMGMGIRAGVAEFPRHALTVEDLFGRARQEWDAQTWMGTVPVLKEMSNG